MSNTKHTDALAGEGIALGALSNRFIGFGVTLAVAGLGASAMLAQKTDPRVAAHAYLLAVVYFISIALGALFFVQLQHLARAGWSTVVRRLAEMIATSLPVLLLFLTPLLIGIVKGSDALLPWADPAVVSHDHALREKAAYLNVPFLLVRVGIYFALWTFFSRFFFNRSVKQDTTGELKLSYTMQWVAAPAMACFVLSATFFSFDFLMSLEPTFISTLFGIYYFAGCAMSFFATTTLLARLLQANGRLKDIINVEHYHDLGKFMFGFVFFWGYAAFSQYMLIWYANIPEETEWFLQRQEGSWVWLSLFLL
ncbi:MAG: quinol:cytochrome C oxidoreductase, partial [Hymenobacter sp.]